MHNCTQRSSKSSVAGYTLSISTVFHVVSVIRRGQEHFIEDIIRVQVRGSKMGSGGVEVVRIPEAFLGGVFQGGVF